MGPPKLLKNKPKKGAVAKAGAGAKVVMESNLTDTVASSHKKSFISRYRYAWPALLAVNLVVGGYVLLRTRTRTVDKELGEDAPLVATESVLQPVSTIRSPPREK
ncbi:uncharacterized protein LOC131027600 isoform X2 [Cryptomeria japonica]|uniref:uncharacterized protein LOC131027600 isoform X2 n=1 Tax=Cryptomeria japonica TaxID=3369 RepID=UPI0027DA98CE|nr:uncharacterized protein LOC131027600 isoform X2 [Cryptomeria japonica]